MKMPEYDGVYVINKIIEFDPGAKIIVVTAYQEYNFDKKKVFSTLIKPYNVEEQLRFIEQGITKGVDAIVVVPADSKGIVP